MIRRSACLGLMAMALTTLPVQAASVSAPATIRPIEASLAEGLLQVDQGPQHLAQANGRNAIQQVVGLVNQVRSRAGLTPLTVNPQLTQAAMGHAQDMAQNDFLSHTGSNGSTMQSRVEATGYSWAALGENVAAGQPDPQSVMRSWMGSEGHRANILNPDFTEIGVGYQTNGNSTYTHYWAQVFGRSR